MGKLFNKKSLPDFLKKRLKGFTIIELLVVIAIIALLSAIVMVAIRGQQDKARVVALLQYSGSVKHALGAYIAGEWKFDNSDASDTSGNGNNGTSNAVAFPDNSVKELKKAAQFNGSSSYVRIPGSNSLNISGKGITMEAWVKPGPVNTMRLILWKTNNFYMTISDGVLLGAVWNGTGYVAPGGCPIVFKTNDKWHHALTTYNGTNLRVFVDGKQVCKSADASGSIASSTDPLCIGALESAGSYFFYFQGQIDEARVYNEPLSPTQIQKLYADGAVRHGLTADDK